MSEDLYRRLLALPVEQLVALMLGGLRRQGAMLGEVLEGVRGQLEATRLPRVARVYLTGCGDSYFAALASRLAFERWTGVPTLAVESLELARYREVRGDSLVVAISATGAVEATLEAAEVARRSGAEVLGVTAEAEGALATRFPSLLVAPPVAADDVAGQGARLLGNFLFSLAGLQLLAAHAARGWGQALEPAVDDAFEDLPDLVEAAVDHAGAVGAYLGDAREDADFYFLGAGPSYGAALFYQAKFFEQARRPVFGAQLEEFAHEQIFLLRPEADAHVWFIAPRGRSRDRAVKIMAGCRELGARVTAVTTTADAALDEVAQLVVPLGELPEVVSPSVTVMPGQLLGLHAFARWGRGERFASRRAQQMSVAHGLTRSRN